MSFRGAVVVGRGGRWRRLSVRGRSSGQSRRAVEALRELESGPLRELESDLAAGAGTRGSHCRDRHGDQRSRRSGRRRADGRGHDLHEQFHKNAAEVLKLAINGHGSDARAAMSVGSGFARTSSALTQELIAWRRSEAA
jgi:hypothetical protein